MDEERIVEPSRKEDDLTFDRALRPKSLDEYIGQPEIKSNLRVFIEAARARNEPLDHTLFHGHPGLGKTTLAHIIAHELNVGIKTTSGPALEKAGDLAAILTNLERGDVLFVDEIHRLNRVVEETLYPAMEDFRLDIIVGQGPHARTLRMELKPFTLVGATTRTGLLTPPLRDRFGVMMRVDFYTPDDLQKIVLRSAGILGLSASEEGAFEIARRARGTPRVANRLLRRVRDFAEVEGDGTIDKQSADLGLKRLEVDEKGLDGMDRRIILTIIEKFDGGPVGLETLAAILSEEKDTLEEVYEPFLLKEGFINRTPRGRVATRRAFKYFGKEYLKGGQKSLL